MSKSRDLSIARLVSVALGLGAFALALPGQSAIQITSPADGTVVTPGQTLIVNVSTAIPFSQLIIIGQDPIGFSQVLTAPPYQFSIQIPSTISPGSYTLTADGTTIPGSGAISESISIDVERTDQPVSLQITHNLLNMNVGDRSGLELIGLYADGSKADLTKSTQTTFVSQMPDIVTVSSDGLVTAIAPGATQIVVNGSMIVPRDG